jgi:two-component system response regulator
MKNNNILLVEDNPDDAKLTIHAFEKNNITNEIVVVNDGVKALDYLFKRGLYSKSDPNDLPTVILLDLKLPKIDGHEVLKQIRANETTKLIPVIILTSSKEEDDLVKCYQNGCNSYVQKPVDFTDFIQAVQSLGMYWLLLNEPPPGV